LCDFFSSVFNDEKEQNFNHLENKNCMYVSKCPRFEIEDIRDRLKKLDVTKSPGPKVLGYMK